jgi:hypothetical protein
MTEANLLLERWRHTYSDNYKFICDGIVNENEWSKATDRVLFLLKELNLASGSYSASLPLEIQRDFRKTVDKAPWREIGQWAYAILHRKENPSFKDANTSQANACRSIAIVNYKKTAGNNSSSTSEIRKYAIRDKELINEQIKLINPSIIVCCGKGMSFQLAKELFQDATTAALIHRSNSVFSGSCWKGSKYYWIDYVHPSMRVGTRELKYYALLELAEKIP